MPLSPIVMIAVIGLVAFGCQWLAWRVKLPAILFLLATGILLGPGTGWLDPDLLFGDLLFPLISLSVAVILFEGSLTLNLAEIKAQKQVVRRLVTVGAAITWVVVAVTARVLFQLSWELSVLFGALTVVTGPTVIMPMLRTVRPNANIANILRWEGIVIDPIGALLVVVVYEFIVAQSGGVGLFHGLLTFVEIILVGLAFGAGAGALLSFLLRRHWVPEFLQSFATLSLVFAAFSFSNALSHESGLLAVTIMGGWLANDKRLRLREILHFKENLTVVLVSGLFILLAARLQFEQLLALGFAPLVLLLIMQFVARPLAVFLSASGSALTLQEKALLSWIAPRGIVAAAVSALFAIRLSASEPQATMLVPLTFLVIIGTVVLQSATAHLLARWLKVAAPEPIGFLIVGANPVARAIGKAIQKLGIRVLLTDSNWDAIKAARMDNLETFYGNPVSEYAEQRIDLVGIGRLLALSPRAEQNAVAGMRFGHDFGLHNIFALKTSSEAEASEKHQTSSPLSGNAFGGDLTYNKLASLLSQGAEIRSTKLSDEYDFERFQADGLGIPLFLLSPRGRLKVLVEGAQVSPEPGWTILSLSTNPIEKTEKKASLAGVSDRSGLADGPDSARDSDRGVGPVLP